MKHWKKWLAVAAMGLLGTTAWANGDFCGGQHGAGFSPEKMQAMMTKRHQMLHDALKLTPAQEPLWQKFEAAHQTHWDAIKSKMADRATWDKLSAPERLEKMRDMSQLGQKALDEKLAALKPLYQALSPEQRKVFDQHGAGMMGGKHHPRG